MTLQALLSSVGLLTSIITLVALFVALLGYRNSISTRRYNEIDQVYFNIQKILIEHPAIIQQHSAEYNTLAFMIFNFLETIYDNCKEDSSLKGTWYPIIDYEAPLHVDWIRQPNNKIKFKNEFYEFILKRVKALESAADRIASHANLQCSAD